MTKKERVIAVIEGRGADAVPACFSMHFPKEHREIDAAVKDHLDFFRQTDTDILKLMNENLVPDAGPIVTPDDWRQIPAMSMEDGFMARQMELTKRVLDQSDPDSFRVGTLHGICASAIHPIEHRYGYVEVRRLLCEHLRQNKAPVLDAMKRIVQVLCQLGQSYIEAGMDGVYYASLGGEKHFFTDEEFAEYIEPFDRQIMQAIREAGGRTILHICKENLNMQRYAVCAPLADVVNWGVYEAPCSLADGKQLFPGCTLMGGFANHPGTVLVDGPEEAIRAEAASIIASAGRQGFILGADCTLPTGISYRHIRAAVETGRIRTPEGT